MLPGLEIIEVGNNNKRLIVRSGVQNLMFRDANRQHLTIMHRNLKDALDLSGMTGCTYIPLSQHKGVGFLGQEVL
jgi:hypothetical protein